MDAYEQLTTEFLKVCQREYPEQITGQDLRNYMAALRQRGLTHRTVCNLYTGVACFLKFGGVDHKALLPYSERPVPDDGLPEAYDEAEVKKFFAALARERDRLDHLLEVNSTRVQSDVNERVLESRHRLEANIRGLLRDVSHVAEQALNHARAAREAGAAAVEAALAKMTALEQELLPWVLFNEVEASEWATDATASPHVIIRTCVRILEQFPTVPAKYPVSKRRW